MAYGCDCIVLWLIYTVMETQTTAAQPSMARPCTIPTKRTKDWTVIKQLASPVPFRGRFDVRNTSLVLQFLCPASKITSVIGQVNVSCLKRGLSVYTLTELIFF